MTVPSGADWDSLIRSGKIGDISLKVFCDMTLTNAAHYMAERMRSSPSPLDVSAMLNELAHREVRMKGAVARIAKERNDLLNLCRLALESLEDATGFDNGVRSESGVEEAECFAASIRDRLRAALEADAVSIMVPVPDTQPGTASKLIDAAILMAAQLARRAYLPDDASDELHDFMGEAGSMMRKCADLLHLVESCGFEMNLDEHL